MLKNYKSKHCFNDNFWVILIVSWLLICKLWLADCWFSELIASWLLAGHTWFVKVSRPSPRPQVPRPQHSLKVYSWQRQEAISWLLVANYNALDTYVNVFTIFPTLFSNRSSHSQFASCYTRPLGLLVYRLCLLPDTINHIDAIPYKKPYNIVLHIYLLPNLY